MQHASAVLLVVQTLLPFVVACDLLRPSGTHPSAGADAGSTQAAPVTPVADNSDMAHDAAAPGVPPPEMRPSSATGAIAAGETNTPDAAIDVRGSDAAPTTNAATAEDAPAVRGSHLTDLTKDGIDELCAWTLGLRNKPTRRELCTIQSLQAESPAACAAQVASCVARGEAEPPSDAACNEDFVQSLPTRCVALDVEDYRACAKAAAESANQRLASVSCDQVGSDDQAAPQSPLPACANLMRICPELAPDDSGAEPTWSGGSFVCKDGWPLFANEVCNGKKDCLDGETKNRAEIKNERGLVRRAKRPKKRSLGHVTASVIKCS